MDIKTINMLIGTVEDRLQVQNIVFKDIKMWPAIRIAIFFELQNYEKSIKSRRRIFELFKSFITPILVSCLDSSKNDVIHESDALFFGFNSSRVKVSSFYIDRFFDPIMSFLKKMDKKSIFFEYFNRNKFILTTPRLHKTIIINPVFRSILQKLDFKKYNLPQINDDIIGNIHSFFLENGFDLNILKPSGYNKLFFLFFRSRMYWIEILKKIKPKTIFIQCYYSLDGMALCSASRELGIRSVDMQHGVICDDHIAYGGWKILPKEGWELLPSIFWVWSDDEFNTIGKWSMSELCKSHRVVKGGNIWMQLYMSKSSLELIGVTEASSCDVRETNKLNVLLSLQWGTKLPDWFIGFVLENNKKINWLVRKHPIDDKNQDEMVRLLGVSKKKVKRYSSMPLPELLRASDVHITYNSSVILEAEMFKIASVALDPACQSYYPAVLERGNLFIAENIGSLDAIMKTIEPRSKIINNKNILTRSLWEESVLSCLN